MNSDNVVIFPKAKKDSPMHTMEEVMDNVIASRTAHIDFITDEILSFIMQRTYEEGFDLDIESCEKPKIMMYEGIRSTLLKSQGIEHFLHKFIDDMVNFTDGSDEK